ncbi:17641_t:CDS:1, partial [Dentiscutata erythropus]
ELSDYKQDLIKKVESDDESEIEYDSDPQIESLAQYHNSDQNSEVDYDLEDKFSELDSDDSDYT